LRAQVLAVAGEHIENIERRAFVILARGQRVEVGHADRVEDDDLAVGYETLLVQLPRGRDVQREAPDPIMTAPPDQAHAVLAADDQTTSPPGAFLAWRIIARHALSPSIPRA
jgi:hypothetical protein